MRDKSNVLSKTYEEFKAKRDEEKKARQKRIEERLLSIRLKRFSAFDEKENVVKTNVISNKKGNKSEKQVNNVHQDNYIKVEKAPQMSCVSGTSSKIVPNILKRKNFNTVKDVKCLDKKQIQKSEHLDAEKKTRNGGPKASNVAPSSKLSSRQDVGFRKMELEIWQAKRLEKRKELESKKREATHKLSMATNALPSRRHLMKDHANSLLVKKISKVSAAATKKVETKKESQKRISLTTRHYAKRKALRLDGPGNQDDMTSAHLEQPGKNFGYILDLKGKMLAVGTHAPDVSKSVMKEKLAKWLERKGKSPSSCRRHMCCYGLNTSTPIGGRKRLEVKSAVKYNLNIKDLSDSKKEEPMTESKVQVKRRIDVQDSNIFKSSHIFLKCREIISQDSVLPEVDDLTFVTPIKTPMKKSFIVTPVRRSTRKSHVPPSLKEHDILVETMDELSAEVKQQSVFRPNKCISHVGISMEELEKKQLKYD